MIKINLQLFADGDILDPATPETDLVDTANVENPEGDQQPVANPEDQSKDKDNPANHAFAEMRRKIKELETENKTLSQKQKEKDEYYADLAKKSGRTDITNEESYRKAVKLEKLAEEYKKSGDPLVLAEIMKESIGPQVVQQTPQTNAEDLLNKEVEDFNKEFKQALKGVDDILTLPNSNEIIGYMQNNNLSLAKAYKLANPDKIAAAAKQAAVNQVKGLNHVTANSNGGNVDLTTVSASEIAQWKQWFPAKTDEQCRKEIIANKKNFSD